LAKKCAFWRKNEHFAATVAEISHFRLDLRHMAVRMLSEDRNGGLSQNQSKFHFSRHGPRFCCVLRHLNVFVHFFRH